MTIAPMSLYTANSLKEKLLQGIDSEGNIVHMEVVRDVLKILENFELSKDDLEETRIGRYVNSMRKRTNDNAIAKQSKSLIRKWQAVVEQAVTNTSVVSGTHSNSGVMPFVHGNTNHRRPLDDAESAANSNCDSHSPVSSLVGNGNNNVSTASTGPMIQQPKGTLSLRIKIGKNSTALPNNESSMSPGLPVVKSNGAPEKRRIKSTAEIANELTRKSDVYLSSELQERLEKQRNETPLQTLNEVPIPSPVLSVAGGQSNNISHNHYQGKQRGKKRLSNFDVHSDATKSHKPNDVKLLSAEKSAMVKRFLDSAELHAGPDGPATPPQPNVDSPSSELLGVDPLAVDAKNVLSSAVDIQRPSPQPPTPPQQPSPLEKTPSPPSIDPKSFTFPNDYARLSTADLYRILSASYAGEFCNGHGSKDSKYLNEEEEDEKFDEKDPQPNVLSSYGSVNEIGVQWRYETPLDGITGIKADSSMVNEVCQPEQVNIGVTAMEVDDTSTWSRWEDCVTLFSSDVEHRPVFILPFVDIPEDEAPVEAGDLSMPNETV